MPVKRAGSPARRSGVTAAAASPTALIASAWRSVIRLSPEVQWAFPRRREILEDLAAFEPDVVHLATEFAMGLTGLRCARALSVRTRGVDPDLFHPGHRSDAFRARLGAQPGDILVACVGRMGPEKGIGVLLDAWALLEDVRLGARLVFVGRGLMEPEVARRGFRDVRVTGMLSGAQLSAAYASADVLVFPSATETFGNVLLEGMASGLACIAAAAGGPVELARHGVDAWLFQPDDVPDLAAALRRLLTDGDLRRRLGHEARATAASRSWTAACAPLFAEYRRAIEARLGRRAA
jgi:phosphatidylinositol alpha 1,6-mannosyltransferase